VIPLTPKEFFKLFLFENTRRNVVSLLITFFIFIVFIFVIVLLPRNEYMAVLLFGFGFFLLFFMLFIEYLGEFI